MFLQVECLCGQINCLSFLTKKERRQFEQEEHRVEEHLKEHPSSTRPNGSHLLHSDPGIALQRHPSAYAQVLRQFSSEVADEYERVQEQHRNIHNLSHYAKHPIDGSRVTLDYALPPWMEGSSLDQPVEHVIREGIRIRLYEAGQSRESKYNVRLTSAMRDELLRCDLAHIDGPDGRRHTNYRFLACRMCPVCFKGPVSEDEVSVLIICMCSLKRDFRIVVYFFLADP